MKVTAVCDFCGKSFDRDASFLKGKRHHFCCRLCTQSFSNKRKNQMRYKEYADHSVNSKLFSEMNRRLNPSRMIPETREKLRLSRLNTGEGKTYSKVYGRHEHRVVAEQMLGRALRPGEVVHHRDGNKRNNDPSNLVVFETQADHAAHHASLDRFLKEVAKLGGGDAR